MRIPKVFPSVHPSIGLEGGTDRIVNVKAKLAIGRKGLVEFRKFLPQLILRSPRGKFQVFKEDKGTILVFAVRNWGRNFNRIGVGQFLNSRVFGKEHFLITGSLAKVFGGSIRDGRCGRSAASRVSAARSGLHRHVSTEGL